MDPNIPPKLQGPKVPHEASCHCGAIKFTVSHPNLQYDEPHSTVAPTAPKSDVNYVVEDRCSICQRNGYVLIYPKREDVVFATDDAGVSCEGKMKEYKGVGRGLFSHKFCGDCGSSLLMDMNKMVPPRFNFGDILAVNVRMFKGIDMNKLNYYYQLD